MKKFLFLILAIFASVVMANAEVVVPEYTSNNLVYQLEIDDFGNREAKLIDWIVDWSQEHSTVVEVPIYVSYGGYTYDVRCIGSDAFRGETLSKCTLPYTIRTISDFAFSGQPVLHTLQFSQNGLIDSIGKQAFKGSALESFYIPAAPSGQMRLGEGTFENCSVLKNVGFGSNVRNLPKEMFLNCTSLDTVVLPGTVWSIGERIFAGCSSLKQITIGSSISILPMGAFSGCTSLESFVMPNTVSYVAQGLFQGCTSLRSVTWSNQITSIPEWTFENCIALDSVVFPAHINTIEYRAFGNCTGLKSIVIPENITTVSPTAFFQCTELKEVTINSNPLVNLDYKSDRYAVPDMFGDQVTHYILGGNIVSIADNMFLNATNLEEVTFGSNIQTIGKKAFANCTSLETITMPTSIADSTFAGCANLREVILGPNAKTIGKGAFANCTSLESITISDGIEQIDVDAFAGCTNLKTVIINSPAIFNQTFTASRSIKDIFGEQVTTYVLGDSLTTIGAYTFAGCANLTNVIIGKNVKTIQNYAFRNWTGCTSITIPEQIEKIGGYVFYGCTNLRTVYWNAINCREQYTGDYMFQGIATQIDTIYLGEHVEYITETLFAGMTQLTSFTLPAHIKGIRDNAFKDCTFKKVYISDLSAWCQLELGHNPLDIADELYLNGELVEGELILPGDITTVANKVFTGYPLITSLVILDNITTLGDSFRGTKLRTVTVGSGVTSMNYTFYNCDSLMTVYMNAPSLKGNFRSIFGEQVTNYILGDNISAIGDGWFYGCTNLSSITIPESVTTIGNQAFGECEGLTEISLPEALTTIGYYAFYGCGGITEIVIPDNVTTIRDRAFEYCNLQKITIGESVDSIGDKVFNGCQFSTIVWNAKNAGDYKKDDTPFYWKVSPYYPYEGTQYITSFIFGKEVEHIPSYLCQEMTGLTEITLPNGLISVGDSVFTRSGNITTIDIPSNVTTLGAYAFGGLYNLNTVYCHAQNPPTMNADKWAFSDNCIYNCTLYVQQSSLNKYKAADGWKKFLSFATIPDEPEEEGIGDIVVDTDGIHKILLDGTLYIIRGEKVYTTTGQEVK